MAEKTPLRTGNPHLDEHFAAASTEMKCDAKAGRLLVTNWPAARVVNPNLLSRAISERTNDDDDKPV